jgi:hypothetical protein
MTQVQILMYHRVGHFPGRVKAHGALYCHLPRFRAQMKMFRLLGYSVHQPRRCRRRPARRDRPAAPPAGADL